MWAQDWELVSGSWELCYEAKTSRLNGRKIDTTLMTERPSKHPEGTALLAREDEFVRAICSRQPTLRKDTLTTHRQSHTGAETAVISAATRTLTISHRPGANGIRMYGWDAATEHRDVRRSSGINQKAGVAVLDALVFFAAESCRVADSHGTFGVVHVEGSRRRLFFSSVGSHVRVCWGLRCL